MAQWNIEKLVKAGITDILIISGQEHCGSIISQFGDGSDYHCNLTYKVQAKAGGIAEAILLAEDWAGDSNIFVILGDNISNIDISQYTTSRWNHQGATIFLKSVKDPQRFGVAEFYQKMDLMGTNACVVTNIEEKPKEPKSNYAVTGYYLYDNTVFNRIKKLNYSARGELEVTDLNLSYLRDNKLSGILMNKNTIWTDAGTLESYKYANKIIENF